MLALPLSRTFTTWLFIVEQYDHATFLRSFATLRMTGWRFGPGVPGEYGPLDLLSYTAQPGLLAAHTVGKGVLHRAGHLVPIYSYTVYFAGGVVQWSGPVC